MNPLILLLRIVNAVMLIAWPFLVWAMVNYGQFHAILIVIVLFFVLRLLSNKHQTHRQQKTGWILSIAGITLGLTSLFLRNHQLLMYYPVVVNAVLLILFSRSLRYGTPIIEKMARIKEPNLPPKGIIYTRKVTYIWCLFFIFNGSVSLGTCLYNNMTLWTLWNGMASYLLIGLLISIEWLVRQWVKK
ncbi:hypothetical protein [Xenorhabdus kozodoii]|uniref:DNA gyrase subunit B n=1 Tax=Xenorhabdus kozodoii TaxID=351676 RepID=A0A2D0L2C8_9GAMM|nr:hypothetical protein [Xenorhabdus kozodoii]PHM69834.1 DNA gyrase subunit B [Xenorhabdus kozodoii]